MAVRLLKVDLRKDFSEELTKFIHDMLMERKMVGFRNQDISTDELVAFGYRFGPLVACFRIDTVF